MNAAARAAVLALAVALAPAPVRPCVAATPADAPLTIATSSSIPPYVIADEQRGLVVDLLREAFASQGFATRFVFASNRRAEQELAAHRVDGAYNLPCGQDGSVFYSEPIVEYQNVVVTLASARHRIATVDDLAGLRVVAFQSAPLYLGPAFGAVARANPDYSEVSHQWQQVSMLYAHHADAVVMDRRIFLYYLARSQEAARSDDHYVIHPLFPPAPRCAAYLEAGIRDAGNRGLDQLRRSGEFDRIVARYEPLQPEQPHTRVSGTP